MEKISGWDHIQQKRVIKLFPKDDLCEATKVMWGYTTVIATKHQNEIFTTVITDPHITAMEIIQFENMWNQIPDTNIL